MSHIKGRTQIVSENKMQRKIFGPKKHEVTGGWRIMHNQELHNWCLSPFFSDHFKEG
jgi:uncharacterized protein YbdZ (MbtH family)